MATMTHARALELAREALKAAAFAAHSEALRVRTPYLVTRDMCPCGQTTGTAATELCQAMRLVNELAVPDA